MKNYVQKGNHLDVDSPANVESGDLVFVGSIFGIAAINANVGDPLVLTLGGVFDLPKVAAEALSTGDPVYFDSGDSLVTGSDGGGANALIGVAVKDAANPSASAIVRLNDTF
ncbi:DUF2190 family protein [Erythrobacter rubeus]|uniref:DUF2190 family protein n=1 Tax=Erythrobacter rubeus TaxID=2760803 RepID=A0ABR8KNI7_9SPHN|nr:DUF2190 family protein [Erythrobacter rubeus]MBD2842243.1 DUF2190 family protein [Erythrobacter rubeus]